MARVLQPASALSMASGLLSLTEARSDCGELPQLWIRRIESLPSDRERVSEEPGHRKDVKWPAAHGNRGLLPLPRHCSGDCPKCVKRVAGIVQPMLPVAAAGLSGLSWLGFSDEQTSYCAVEFGSGGCLAFAFVTSALWNGVGTGQDRVDYSLARGVE